MSSNWKRIPLVDCTVDGNISYGIVQPGEPVDIGVPVIRINNIKNGRVDISDVLRVSPEIEKNYAKTRLEGGEILLTVVGSTGQSLIVPDELKGWNVPRAIAVIKPKKEIGAKWINICLQTENVRNFLDARANTTVQKTLNLKDVKEIPIPIPPENIKIGIENIFYSLDSKINNNYSIKQTLETITQALFKSWFVDFDPVKAKIEAKEQGKDPQLAAMIAISGKTSAEINQLSSNKRNELATTADLFPDEMERRELGDVPKGWIIGKIGDIYDTTSGGTPSREFKEFYIEGEVNWVKSKELSNTFIFETEEKITQEAIRKSSAKMLPENSVLLAMYGATVGQFCILGVPASCNQAICAILPNKNYPYSFIFSWLKENKVDVISRASGSAQQNISQIIIKNIELDIPPVDILNAFHIIVDVLFREILHKSKEISILGKLRDELLPPLLNGTLTFNRGGEE